LIRARARGEDARVPELIGRDEELETVAGLLVAGAGMVLLEGEPGIGKTSLWEAGIAQARAAGWRVLSSRHPRALGRQSVLRARTRARRARAPG
jgi:MoxR-like ATPase